MLAVTQLLMYASAVFYSFERLKQIPAAGLREAIEMNPLAYFSEQSRNLVVWGEPMDWWSYGWVTLVGLVVMIAGYKLFMGVKQAFADVI